MVSIVKVVLFVLAVVFILATVLPFIKAPHWWIRMFDFPRAQIAVGMLVLLALYGLVNLGLTDAKPYEWVVFALLALGVVYQGARMLPYSPVWPEQSVRASPDVPEDRHLRVVVSNVLMENRDIDRWKRVILAEDPDVIATVETDQWWANQLQSIKDNYPYSVEQPQDDTYGMLLFSRFPLVDPEVRHLVEDTVPSIFARAALPSGDTVQVVLLHPRPPRPDIQQHSTLRDAELVRAATAVQDLDSPLVVMGDMNDVAWSRTTRLFQKLSRLLDPRIGRGLYATFHAEHWYLRYPLDHVFHSEDLTIRELRRLDAVGGDHFPMLIEFAYEPRAASTQEEPEADADDVDDAEEMLDDAQEKLQEESDAEERERERDDQ